MRSSSPGRRLLDPETAAEFHRRDAVLRRHDQVDGCKPECQRQLGRVEDRARRGRCLLLAPVALIETPTRQHAMPAMARGLGRSLAALVLSDEERSWLEGQVRRHRVARSTSDRCRMILRCADGLGNKAVAAELGVHERTVGKWRRCFLKERIEGLSDEPRPGRPRTIEDEQVARVIERTLSATPTDATHWSLRSMARESGLSHTTIWRIWV